MEKDQLLPPVVCGDELAARLAQLHEQQLAAGLIRQDFVDQIKDVAVPDPADSGRRFWLSLNPARIHRPQAKPGDGQRPGDCPLCLDVIARLRPLQMALPVGLPTGVLLAMANPFPLVPGGHFTLARPARTREQHPPQAWQTEADAAEGLGTRAEEIIRLAAAGAGIVWNNGIGAGATVDHYHHQCLFWSRAEPPPLWAAIARVRQRGGPDALLLGPPDYPISALVVAGRPETVCARSRELLRQWVAQNTDTGWLSSTMLAMRTSAPDRGEVVFVFVPRQRDRERVAGLTGAVAAYEIAGVLVLSSPADQAGLESGGADFDGITSLLNSVQDHRCRATLARIKL